MARRPLLAGRLSGPSRAAAVPDRIRDAGTGRAEIRDLGIGVDQLLELLAQVRQWEALVARHPGLHPEDVRAALDYAAGG